MNKIKDVLMFFLRSVLVIFGLILHTLAPLFTAIFLIISFFNQSEFSIVSFYISTILYLIGVYMRILYIKLETPNDFKSQLDIYHPFLGTLLQFLFEFLPFAFIGLIISVTSNNYTYWLHYTIISNWIFKIIKFIIDIKKHHNISLYKKN